MKIRYLFVLCGLFAIAACSPDNQPANRLHVNVIDWQGKGIANATVVVGNQAGEVEAVSSTDSRGETYFDSAPSNATVTAAIRCTYPSSDRTYHYVDIVYGLNVAVVALTLGTCDGGSTQEVNVAVTDQVAGIASREVTIGPLTYGGSSPTMDFSSAVQDDGTISVFASGYDDAGHIKGYGFTLDRPAVNGSVIDVVIDRTEFARHTHRFGNVPSSAVGYSAFASLLRKQAATNLPFNFIYGGAPLPATVDTFSFAGFADGYEFGASVDLDRDGDGNADAMVGLQRRRSSASDQLFDFGLTPVVPGNLALIPGTGGRPVISWSNNDTRSTVQTIFVSRRETVPQKNTYYYSMTAPASATGVVFPGLPDALAAFRLGAYDDLSLATMKFDKPVSYDDYLKAFVDHRGNPYAAEGLASYSYARIEREQ